MDLASKRKGGQLPADSEWPSRVRPRVIKSLKPRSFWSAVKASEKHASQLLIKRGNSLLSISLLSEHRTSKRISPFQTDQLSSFTSGTQLAKKNSDRSLPYTTKMRMLHSWFTLSMMSKVLLQSNPGSISSMSMETCQRWSSF